MKRKMTKQEIKDFVSIRVLYFVIMIFIRNFVFSVIMGIVPFVVHFIPMNNLAYIIVDMIIAFVITELIFQKFIYKYAYKNVELKHTSRYWWLEILRISVIPLFLYYIIGMWYFHESGRFLFAADIEMVYLIMAHGKDLIDNGRNNIILIKFSDGITKNIYTNLYIVSFIIISAIRLLISELVIYNAVKKREKHRDSLINGGIKDEYNKKA